LAAPPAKAGWCSSKFYSICISHTSPANKNDPFKIMQLALIALQLRIFTLLPTMQNPSHYIEVQKVCHYNSISTSKANDL
jgi:hypothetical protein